MHVERQVQPEPRCFDEADNPGDLLLEFGTARDQHCLWETILQVARERGGIVAQLDGADTAVTAPPGWHPVNIARWQIGSRYRRRQHESAWASCRVAGRSGRRSGRRSCSLRRRWPRSRCDCVPVSPALGRLVQAGWLFGAFDDATQLRDQLRHSKSCCRIRVASKLTISMRIPLGAERWAAVGRDL